MDDEQALTSLFGQSPPRPPSPGPSTVFYALSSGEQLSIRLVGSHTLWGHIVYPSARQLSQYIENNVDIVRGKTVVELGAGGGLPGLVAARLGAAVTVISDYDDPKLISNIEHNIRANDQTGTHAVGQTWGSSVRPLLEPLDGNRFDVILLADIVFNHSQHAALLQTCEAILHGERGRALCFYSHHRPWLVDADERLFSLAEERGWRCERVWRDEEAGVAFPEDRGDAAIRGTVHGWSMTPPILGNDAA